MFVDDVDNTYFCLVLTRVIAKQRWILLAFCLMPTHYHLVVVVPENSLPLGMQALNGNFANGFNRRHGRTGHLKGRRYSCTFVDSDEYMLNVVRYVARNPVEAGLCDNPRDWYWGSYRGTAGYDREFPFVESARILSYFGDVPELARAELRAFVGDY
jgi:REP-associated tyrosine transposase